MRIEFGHGFRLVCHPEVIDVFQPNLTVDQRSDDLLDVFGVFDVFVHRLGGQFFFHAVERRDCDVVVVSSKALLIR